MAIFPIIDLTGNSSKKVAIEMQKAELQRKQTKFVLEYVEKHYVEPEKPKPILPMFLRIPTYIIFSPIIIAYIVCFGTYHEVLIKNHKDDLEKKAKELFREKMIKEGYKVDKLL